MENPGIALGSNHRAVRIAVGALLLALFNGSLITACQPAPLPPLDASTEATTVALGGETSSETNEHASEAADGDALGAEGAEVTEAGTVAEVAEAATITPAPFPSPTALDLNNVEELEAFLRKRRIALTFNDEVKLTYLPGMARIYEIGNGTDSLQLHAYPTVDETDEAAGCFSPDAMFVNDLEDPGNPFKVEWFGSPHVFRSQNLLATYIGDDPQILEALTLAFGPQFAGF